MIQDLRNTLSLLRPEERRRFLGVVGLMVCAALFEVVGIASILPLLHVVTNPSSIQEVGWLGQLFELAPVDSVTGFIVLLSLGTLALIIARNGVMALSQYAQIRFQWSITHTVSMRLMDRYLARNYEFFLTRNSSKLSKNILDEARQLVGNAVGPQLQVISKGVVLVAVLIFLLYVDVVTTVLLAGVLGLSFWLLYRMIRTRLTEIGADYVVANQNRYKIAAEAFQGIKEVKFQSSEGHFLRTFEPESERYARLLGDRAWWRALPNYIIEPIAFGGLILALVIILTAQGTASAIVPIIGLFAFGAYRIFPSLKGILGALSSMRFNDRLMEVLSEDLKPETSEISTPNRRTQRLDFQRQIEVRDLTYHYPGAREPALENVSVSIPKGSTTAFIGETGAGKTTLVDTLLGLLEPSSGSITVDGYSISEEREAWQNIVGYVPQDIYLTDDTIRNNIAFGEHPGQIDDARVEEAAKAAQVAEFIETQLPDGYETRVGERGIRLSGGQRQRLGIARALYRQPDVLILDEATSDVDGSTEARITEALDQTFTDVTIIAIAHRLSTIRDYDAIHLIDEGRIVGTGTFDQLLEQHPSLQAMAHGTTKQ